MDKAKVNPDVQHIKSDIFGTEGLPEAMEKCNCGMRRDAGFQIQSYQFPNLHQCGECGGFYQEKEGKIERGGEKEKKREKKIVNQSGLHPLKHAVLLLPYEVEEVTKGGIVLPYQVQERDQLAEQRAVIIEIGESADVGIAEVGDKILFSKWSGQIAIGINDRKKYRIVNDRDIFLTIEDGIDV